MARSAPVENLLPLFVGSVAHLATEVTQWAALSCSRPQPASDNSVRDAGSNGPIVTSRPLQSSTPERMSNNSDMQICETNQECSKRDRSRDLWNTRTPHSLCGNSGWPHQAYFFWKYNSSFIKYLNFFLIGNLFLKGLSQSVYIHTYNDQ